MPQRKKGRQAVDSSFKDFVLEQLAAACPVTCKGMFGGFGLYAGEHFFAIIDKGRFYLRTDEAGRKRFEGSGMEAFQPSPKMKLKTYYEVPASVLEDREELARWAERAVNCAKRSKKPQMNTDQPGFRYGNR
jgi:DNA transformation protein and related proteins